MTSTMMQIGNSVGVIIPADIRKKAKLPKGSKVAFEVSSNGEVVISKIGAKKSSSSITPEFLEIVNRVNTRYARALKKLAGK